MNREGPMKPVVFPKDTTNDPARTVDAHPEKKTDTSKTDASNADATKKDSGTDSAKPADLDGQTKPADKTDKPQTAPAAAPAPAPPAQPSAPSSNFYPGATQPAAI